MVECINIIEYEEESINENDELKNNVTQRIYNVKIVDENSDIFEKKLHILNESNKEFLVIVNNPIEIFEYFGNNNIDFIKLVGSGFKLI